MRKVLPITLIFLLLTLSMTSLATAQRQNIITNETTETLYVVSSTKFGAQDDIPAGYRTSGWKTITAGQQRAFWAYDPHKIYFQIWKGSEPIKPQPSTDTFAFWINRSANFDIVTRQEINASIPRGELLYSSHGTNPLTHRDGFMRYDNGSRITVTNAWVNASEEAVVPNAPVNIPDPKLRAAIADALGKAQGATIAATDMQKLTVLSVPEQGIEDLTGLQFATNLTELDIEGSMILDVSSLGGLSNLTTLNLSYNQITDVSPLTGLGNLTTLNLNSTDASDFSSLAGLSNLTQLELDFNNILDVSFLAGLSNLTALYLVHNEITDVSPLAGLSNLTTLYLGGNEITDVSPLAGLSNLTTLALTLNQITDVSFLAGLTNLTALYLSHNQITDVSSLGGLTNLTALYLENNAISDFSPIAGLIPNLEDYSKDNQRVEDVDRDAPVPIPTAGDDNSVDLNPLDLDLLPRLKSSISDSETEIIFVNQTESDIAYYWVDYEGNEQFYNRVEAGTFFNQHSFVGHIWLVKDPNGVNLAVFRAEEKTGRAIIRDLSNDNQRAVDLDPNALVHIPAPQLRAAIADALGKAQGDAITVTDMQKLTILSADVQGIEDLNGLQFATNLTELGGNRNQITDVSPLAGLINLTRLYLGYNQITDVSPLAGLSNLTTLALENNAISDFSPIGELIPNLEFYADHNQRAVVPNDLVNIPDPVLRRAIVKTLNIPENTPITPAEMKRLTLLQAGVAWKSGDPTITDLTGLEFATNLTELEAYWNEISDVSPLADLTKLTRLILTGNNISDVSPLVGLENLRVLDLSENGISDVSLLAGLVDLTELELNTNQISDVFPLSGLKNLTRLELYKNRISDVSPLSGLINLRELLLITNDISDVSPLSGLINLTFLSLGWNDISDVSSLARLISLTVLDLRSNFISDVSPLSGLINLRELLLDGNAISDFSPIAGLIPNLKHYSNDNQRAIVEDLNFPVNIPDPNLRAVIAEALNQAQGATITARKMRRLSYIGVEQADVQDLTGLEFATSLTRLDLEENAISDISPLAGLINLTWLNLRRNAISDISPLAGLINLTWLDLGTNDISNVSPLAGLVNLTELWIGGNQISDVSPLAGLINLTELWIGGNQISDVSPLAGLVNLTKLWIGRNQISDMSPLAGLTNLVRLDLAENNISDVSPLAGLTNLTTLSLQYNNISDFTSLDGLKEAGVKIDIHGQGFVEISQIGYSPSDAGLSVSVSGISQDKFKVGTGFQEVLTYTVVNTNGEPVPGITLALLAFPSSEVTFHPSTITTDAKGQATTILIIDRAGEFDLWANMKVSQKTTNQHGNTVYKHYDGNETVLIKGLELSDVNEFTYDHTQFYPPRHGKHFRIYGQGDANTCGQTSARMVLSYYGVDVGLHTFDDVADIHTWVVGATPDEMRAGLRLLPVELTTYSGTSENYPRDQSLRDKISESRPPILVIRVGKNAYHHVVVVGYDTRTNSFLIADPGVKGYFHWMPWDYLNPQWRLDYVPGYTWEEYWEDFTNLNKLGSAPFVPDVKFVIKWFGGLAPYRMFVPDEAPPYHHLESKTVQIYETGDVEWNPLEWDWHDWKREETFGGKVIATSWFAERRDGDVREVRREGNKVIVSGRISNGVPLDANIPFVDEVFYGAVDMVLTAYYDPSAMAAPSVVLPPLSKETALLPNYPNPFNPETWIPYHLAEPANVTLTIYAIDGKVVRRLDLGHQDAGYYQSKARAAYWDGRNSIGERVASGLYFYTLAAGDFAATRKMLIMK